jgi:hypothetical protein
MAKDNKPKIRWKTISIRGLMLFVMVIGAWLGWLVNKARRQQAAVTAVQRFGGFVHYEWEFVDGQLNMNPDHRLVKPSWGTLTPGRKPWAPVWLRNAIGDEYFQSLAHVSLCLDIRQALTRQNWVNMGPADDMLRELASQTSVRTLQLGGDQVADENLAYVGKMAGLEELYIGNCSRLTDKAFANLGGLKRLRILDVDSCKMTDASLAVFSNLTNLEQLHVFGDGFSDRGLAHLERLTGLRALALRDYHSRITDAGVESLSRMKMLQELGLDLAPMISNAAVGRLRGLKSLRSIYIERRPSDWADQLKRMSSSIRKGTTF